MYNILVCDDEKDIVSALTIYLTTSGYRSSLPMTAPKPWPCWRRRTFTWSCWTL